MNSISLRYRDTDACWTRTSGRGVGTALDQCPEGTELDTPGCCYTKCRDGFRGSATSCIKDQCPPNSRSHALTCESVMNWNSYCFADCPSDWPEKKACNCWSGGGGDKERYDRGTLVGMSCGSGKEPSDGLCYVPCPEGTQGIGPVCWTRTAPPGYPSKCGDVGWGKDDAACVKMIAEIVKAGVSKIADAGLCISAVLAAVATGGAGAVGAGITCAKFIGKCVAAAGKMAVKYDLCPV
jgi:hypothetical protein